MRIIVPLSPSPVEDQLKRAWSDPEALQDLCIEAIDTMLGHDGERLAAVAKISRRELNKQRERRNDLLRKQWLHRLIDLGRAVEQKFGAARTAPAAHLFARACGHELAKPVQASPATGRVDPMALFGRSMKEFGEAASNFAAAAQDGIDRAEAKELLKDVDEALREIQGARNFLAAIVDGNEPNGALAGPRGTT